MEQVLVMWLSPKTRHLKKGMPCLGLRLAAVLRPQRRRTRDRFTDDPIIIWDR